MSYKVFVVNLSKEGMFIITDRLDNPVKFNPGTKLELIVELPGWDKVNLSCRVIRSQEIHPQGLASNIGLEIIDPPLEYIEFLKKEGIDDSKTSMFGSSSSEDFR